MTSRAVPIPTAQSFGATASQFGQQYGGSGPYFGLIDISESGEALWLVSDGSGRFVQLRPPEPVPQLLFIVEKRRATRQLVIEILAPVLKRTIRKVLGQTDVPGSSLVLDVTALLTQYRLLRDQIDGLHTTLADQVGVVQLKLLLHGCLLDQTLYYGANVDILQCLDEPTSRVYLQDVLHQKLLLGLEELDDCFHLGLMTEEETTMEVSVFNQRFEQLAYAGDLNALQEHMEPAVRAGEIEVQHDEAFLANILANGPKHKVIHQYVVDLSQRCPPRTDSSSGSEAQDVSADPMYEAIKQGHLQTLRLCILNQHVFSGHIRQDTENASMLRVTPLVAAVIWKQVEVLRLLLDAGPQYLDGWTQAMSWAAAFNHGEIHGIMKDFEKHHMGAPHHPESMLHPFGVITAANRLESPQSPQSSHRASREPPRSVSEIANRMAGLGWGESARRSDQFSVFSSGASTPTPAGSSWTTETMRSSSQAGSFPAYHIVQPSSAHAYRVRNGREIAHKLDYQCERLRLSLATSSWESMSCISHFASIGQVWQAGLECARHILYNRAPSSATEVLQLLLVAEALDANTSDPLGDSKPRDLCKWRTAVRPQEQHVFDELIRVTFGKTSASGCNSSNDISELWRVQELAQNLVSMHPEEARKNDSPSARGLRLPFIYNCHHLWHKRNDHEDLCFATSGRRLTTEHGPEPPERNSYVEWQGAEDFNLFDFIKIEAVQEETTAAQRVERISSKDTSWKSVAPTVVLLLGSQEFSTILQAIQQVQLPDDHDTPDFACQEESICSGRTLSALDRLEAFCRTAHRNAFSQPTGLFPAPPLDGSYESLIPAMKAWIQGGLVAGDKLSQSLDPYFLQGGTRSRGLSTGDMALASSLSRSVPSTRTSKPLDRLRCLSLGCPKTFSNVSNRNKHMREGCAFRENPGYRCRNEGCTKTLTTKWYRSTHETTRCRYRSVMVGQGSPLALEDSLMGGVPGG